MSVEGTGLRFYQKVAIVTGGCDGVGRGCVDILGMLFIISGAGNKVSANGGTSMKLSGNHLSTMQISKVKWA
jgi:NAD(P)-dependent dehydrogenase (short-subunit alcohol dehydrogenase family)